MKKLFLLLGAMFVFCFVNSQELDEIQDIARQIDSLKNKKEVLVNATNEILDSANVFTTEAERVIDKYSGKVWDALSELAETLSVPAEHVYGVMIQQYTQQGLIGMILLFLPLLIGIIVILVGIALFKSYKKDTSYSTVGDTAQGVFSIICFVLGIIGVIAFVIAFSVNFSDAYLQFTNSEYYVIQDILDLIK